MSLATDTRYCVVMEKADRDLNFAITHERFAGSDWAKIKSYCRDLLRALNHLHTRVRMQLYCSHSAPLLPCLDVLDRSLRPSCSTGAPLVLLYDGIVSTFLLGFLEALAPVYRPLPPPSCHATSHQPLLTCPLPPPPPPPHTHTQPCFFRTSSTAISSPSTPCAWARLGS